MDPYLDASALDPAAPHTELKLANLQLADDEHRARVPVLRSLPSKLTLQTTDACNLDCPHCQIPRAEKTARMDRAVLDAVVRELFPALIELHPTNLGEPFAWPLFGELCAEMAQHGVLLDLTTNGTLVSDERLEWIAPIARDVKVSFDGATTETFERLRRGARFDAVCANVRALVTRLDQVRVRRPMVALQMTLMRSNVHELPGLVRLAADLGARRVKAYHLFAFTPELDRESLAGDDAVWRPILEEALAEGARCEIDLQLAEPSLRPGAPIALERITCHLPWHETWVDVDGAVLPCHSHGGDVAGNLLEQPFTEVWNGPLYRRIRGGFAADRPVWHCDGCGMTLRKPEEHAFVPYDPESFLSVARAPSPSSPILGARSSTSRPPRPATRPAGSVLERRWPARRRSWSPRRSRG